MKLGKKILKRVKSGELTEREIIDFNKVLLKLEYLKLLPKKTKKLKQMFKARRKKNVHHISD